MVKSKEQIEKRLNDDQKAIYKFNRKAKLESKVLSEDEVRKRRKEAKLNAEMNTLEYPTRKCLVSFLIIIKKNTKIFNKLKNLSSINS